MGSVNDFGFLNAKLKARIGLLESSPLVEDLLKAPTLSDAVSRLGTGGYKNLEDVYEKSGDIEEVELSIFAEEIESHMEVRALLPKRAVPFMDGLLEKLEIENLKSAMRTWYAERVRARLSTGRASYIYRNKIVNEIPWEGLINAISWDDILKALENTPYFATLSTFGGSVIRDKGLFWVEIEIDKAYYGRLYASMKSLSHDDMRLATSIYDTDMDLKNILLLVRYGYYHSLPREDLKRIALPYGNLYRELSMQKALERDEVATEIRRVASHAYKDILDDIEELEKSESPIPEMKSRSAKDILSIEKYLSKVRDKEYISLLHKDPFSIGIMLSYFYLRGRMDRTIRSILSAKRYRWSEERIRREII